MGNRIACRLVLDLYQVHQSRQTLPVPRIVPLSNLLGNALKFSRADKPPVIEISSRTVSADELREHVKLDIRRSYCEIIFVDNGIGIDPRFAERVFTIFQRLNTQQRFEGTGVGLALCKRIVTNHGGDIYVLPNKEGGSSFHIFLPLAL